MVENVSVLTLKHEVARPAEPVAIDNGSMTIKTSRELELDLEIEDQSVICRASQCINNAH